MIFIALAVVSAGAALWLHWMSGQIEATRLKLKDHRGITKEQSAFRKQSSLYAKYGSYGLGCLAVLSLWLHFGLGL